MTVAWHFFFLSMFSGREPKGTDGCLRIQLKDGNKQVARNMMHQAGRQTSTLTTKVKESPNLSEKHTITTASQG